MRRVGSLSSSDLLPVASIGVFLVAVSNASEVVVTLPSLSRADVDVILGILSVKRPRNGWYPGMVSLGNS